MLFELLCGEVFKPFVILSKILLPIISPISCAVFWIALFEAALIVSVVVFLAVSGGFWL